jgi:acyl carrier protein
VDDTHERLVKCFAAAFPTMAEEQIQLASAETVAAWDSIAGATLFAVIEEEFGLEFDPQDLADLLSFPQILAYLQAKTVA